MAEEFRKSTLRLIDLAEVEADEARRLRELDARAAVSRLLEAIHDLAQQEARRLRIPFLDATYNGCDPAWRDVLNAARDLRNVADRDL
jgi:hypothetical protein